MIVNALLGQTNAPSNPSAVSKWVLGVSSWGEDASLALSCVGCNLCSNVEGITRDDGRFWRLQALVNLNEMCGSSTLMKIRHCAFCNNHLLPY